MHTSSSTIQHNTSRQGWAAVIAVGLATFAVVTTEMLPVGLLTPIATDLGISTGTAGLMMSVPALLAALFAPCIVIASKGMDRRTMLRGLLALLVFANLMSALAASWTWMLVARVMVGFCMGGIWAIAGGLAARLVPGHAIGMATSIIFGGVAAASVLGVPIGALLGEMAGWRWAFGGMAICSVLVLLLHIAVIPALPVSHAATVRQFRVQLGNRKLQAGLLLTLLLVAGHFMSFTFVRPLLLTVADVDAEWIGALLFAYGVAGMMGNFLTGIIVGRRTVLTLMLIALGLTVIPVLFLYAGHRHIGSTIVLLAWGLVYGGVSVGLMTWMMKAVPDAIEIATALYVSLFNVGIATGAWMGGKVVDIVGLPANLWVAAGIAGSALLLVMAMATMTTARD